MCRHTYRRDEPVVALQQQCAQLRPAQSLQLVLLQYPLVVIRAQLVGEAASSPVVNTTHIVQSLVGVLNTRLLGEKGKFLLCNCYLLAASAGIEMFYTDTTLIYSNMLGWLKVATRTVKQITI